MNNRWLNVTCRTIAVDSFLLQKLHDFDVCQWGVVEGLQSRWGIFQACQILQATNTAQTIIWNISIILHGYWLFPRLNYWKRLGKETACIAQYEYIRTVIHGLRLCNFFMIWIEEGFGILRCGNFIDYNQFLLNHWCANEGCNRLHYLQ